jgi:hypothetical protein
MDYLELVVNLIQGYIHAQAVTLACGVKSDETNYESLLRRETQPLSFGPSTVSSRITPTS